MIALPMWLVTNALVAAGLYPVAWLLCRLFQSRPAASNLVWLVLLVKLVAPPLVYWPWSVRQLTDFVVPHPAPTAPTPVAPAVFTPADVGTTDDQIVLQPIHIFVEQSAPLATSAETQSPLVANERPYRQKWNYQERYCDERNQQSPQTRVPRSSTRSIECGRNFSRCRNSSTFLPGRLANPF